METITIPSPTAFLSSPIPKPASEPPKRKPSIAKSTIPPKKQPGVVKPKQSKSRNGCITCKAKRLKCDETKPSCQQCHKRNVECGGYKKDFKWRPFEETTFKTAPKPKRNSISKPRDPITSKSPKSNASSPNEDVPVDEIEEDIAMHDSFFNAAAPSPPLFTTPNTFSDLNFDHHPMFDMATPPFMRDLPKPRLEADSVTKSLNSLFEDSPRPTFSGQSPRLIDLLLPGSELNAKPNSLPELEMPPSMDLAPIDHFPLLEPLDDDVEEVHREPQTLEPDMWMLSSASPPIGFRQDPFMRFYRQPEVKAGSPEELMRRFDRYTCGILSVKDGPTENPWRTLIWPLARDSPALYHAIASMTAFHTSRDHPSLRVDGMEHMRRSIRSLATGIGDMRTDTALATTLALAFSESWDQHISTGIEHLRGAKILVNQALISHRKQNLIGDDFARLRFLCNTWVYMDVISRLTSFDEDESNDFDQVLSLFGNMPNSSEIDPLMGCASSLFPLVGKVANLCRKVRKMESNSIAVIGRAMELKEEIVQWSPPSEVDVDRPEDSTSEVRHALQTAEAYRYATLLYLHQAVPEIPSWTSAQLAKKVLVYLATVPLGSRLLIVHIYPLLAAGCEVEGEDRVWVKDRWQAMGNRMWIGNIDRCWEVMQEVWARRDSVEAAREAKKEKSRPSTVHSESSKRQLEEEMDGLGMLSPNRTSFSMERKRVHEPVEDEMDRELTVRGRLHWVGVMKDWEWEILLG